MKTTLAIIAFMLLISDCTSNFGGSTETTNQFVSGILYEPDGVTPADSAIVVIRPGTMLASIPAITAEHTQETIDTVVTDKNGSFSFDKILDNGYYTIEARKGDNAVFINPVTITGGNLTEGLTPDTLKPPGEITGAVILGNGGDHSEVYVLAFGIDRFMQCDASGNFTLHNLGKGDYHLKFVTTIEDYRTFDTSGIPVYSSDTTFLDTIRLQFDGIPLPRGLNVTYDPATLNAHISWSGIEHPDVNYFNVYRMPPPVIDMPDNRIFTEVKRINETQITDTFFVDTTIRDLLLNTIPPLTPSSVYYRVTICDSLDSEGPPSEEVQCVFNQYFTKINILQLAENQADLITDFAVSAINDIYVIDNLNSFIYHLDSALNFKGTIATTAPFNYQGTIHPFAFVPGKICVSNTSGLLYVSQSDDAAIHSFDTSGIRFVTFDEPVIARQGIEDIEIINNQLHVLTRSDSVLIYTEEGILKTAWRVEQGHCLVDDGTGQVIIGKDLGYHGEISRHDSSGNLISIIELDYIQPTAIAGNSNTGYLYVLSTNPLSIPRIMVYNTAGKLIDRYPYSFSAVNNSLCLTGDGTMLVHDGKSVINFDVFNNYHNDK